MDNFEKNISSQLQSDKLPFDADPAIYERLSYQMQLKSSGSAVHKNHFLPALSVLFASKFIAWKVGIAALFLFSIMGYEQFKHEGSIPHIVDTAQIIQSIDTTNFLIEDSLSVN